MLHRQQHSAAYARERAQAGNRARSAQSAPVDTALTWITVDPRSR